MGEYLDKLGPEVTMGTVFTDLYGRVDKTIADLDDLREDKRSNKIPGTSLEFDHNTKSGTGRGSHCTRRVLVVDGTRRQPLIGRTRHVIPPNGAIQPEGVRAYRGNEIDADYSVVLQPSGMVACKLGFLGINGRYPNREPFGTASRVANERIGGLPDAYTARIEIVASAIVANLDAVEGMAYGMSVEEAFSEAGLQPLAA